MERRTPVRFVVVASLAVLGALFGGSGCTLEQRVPVREVALDFSDHDFYDRAYAPSPDWRAPSHGAEATFERPGSTIEGKPRAGGPAFSPGGR